MKTGNGNCLDVFLKQVKRDQSRHSTTETIQGCGVYSHYLLSTRIGCLGDVFDKCGSYICLVY